MKHLNGNILCAIDVETTGLVAGHHEITEVCVMPLDADMKPWQDVLPFNMLLKIEFEDRIDWDALRVTKTDFFKHQQTAMDKFEAAELFEDWCRTRLKLPDQKRISPLAHNWPFDRGFMQDWLCPAAFNEFVDGRFRDSMALALAINDIYDMMSEPIPFPKVNLGYLASQLKIQHPHAHSALADCDVTAKVYRQLTHPKYLKGLG